MSSRRTVTKSTGQSSQDQEETYKLEDEGPASDEEPLPVQTLEYREETPLFRILCEPPLLFDRVCHDGQFALDIEIRNMLVLEKEDFSCELDLVLAHGPP